MRYYFYVEIRVPGGTIDKDLYEIRSDAGVTNLDDAVKYAKEKYPEAIYCEVMEVNNATHLWGNY